MNKTLYEVYNFVPTREEGICGYRTSFGFFKTLQDAKDFVENSSEKELCIVKVGTVDVIGEYHVRHIFIENKKKEKELEDLKKKELLKREIELEKMKDTNFNDLIKEKK